jgi:hypothetical protein
MVHAEFEGGLSILILENRPTRQKISQLENLKISKKVKCVQTLPAHFISHPALFELLCV